MPRIEDAMEAEDIVRSYYSNPLGPHPYNFDTHKQGYTWVVRFNIQSVTDIEDHEWHIRADTGRVLRKD